MKRHKRITFYISFLLLLTLACRTLSFNSSPTLIGDWEGQYEGNTVLMTFYDDDNMSISVNKYIDRGTYIVDYSASPILLELDLESYDELILILVEFIDQDTIRIGNNNPGEESPASFSESMIMNRISK